MNNFLGTTVKSVVGSIFRVVRTSDDGYLEVNSNPKGHSSSVTITRPSDTTAYTAGDAVGDAGGSAIIVFSGLGLAGGEIEIVSVQHEIDVAAIPSGMAGFKLHLYNASPTAIADNAAWDLIAGDRASYLGYCTLSTPEDLGGTLFFSDSFTGKQIKLTTTSLYAVLQTVGGYTPTASAVKKVTIHTKEI